MRDCNPHFHATLNNDKLGGKSEKILAIGYVPGSDLLYLNNGTMVSDCKGTCGAVDCSGCGFRGICYAIDSYCQYPAVTVNRIENTLQLRTNIDLHFLSIYYTALENKVETIRYTESGEIETYTQFSYVVELAEKLPNVKIYLYTKNYAVLRKYFESAELPENMVVLISIWENTGVSEFLEMSDHNNIKAFVVNNQDIKVNAMCPAYHKNPKTGKVERVKDNPAVKCGNCGLCTGKHKCKIIGCLEH